MTPQIQTHFIITGIFNPEELTDTIGLDPTKVWRAGETVKDTLVSRRFDGWKLSTPEVSSYELDEEIKKIISFLDPHKLKIREYCAKHNLNIELSCIITTEEGEFPSVHFDRKLIEDINNFNAEIDIDFQ